MTEDIKKTHKEEKQVLKFLAKEFLEHLGIEVTNKRINLFAKHIKDFEREIQNANVQN